MNVQAALEDSIERVRELFASKTELQVRLYLPFRRSMPFSLTLLLYIVRSPCTCMCCTCLQHCWTPTLFCFAAGLAQGLQQRLWPLQAHPPRGSRGVSVQGQGHAAGGHSPPAGQARPSDSHQRLGGAGAPAAPQSVRSLHSTDVYRQLQGQGLPELAPAGISGHEV